MIDYYSNYDFVSQSMLKVFHKSPEEYFRRFVLKPNDPRFMCEKESTDSMILGRLVHSIYLEQGPLENEFHIVDLPDRRSNAWKAEKANAEEWGKTPVLKSVVETAQNMADSARSNPHVRRFFETLSDDCSELREQEIYWQGEFLPKKAKLDQIISWNENGVKRIVVVELKTTSDPTVAEFTRQYRNMLYHVQAAWYEDGLKSLLKADSYRFEHVVVAVRNSEPHDAALYPVNPAFVEIGQKWIAAYEPRLAWCYNNGDWTLNGVQEQNTLTPEKWMQL